MIIIGWICLKFPLALYRYFIPFFAVSSAAPTPEQLSAGRKSSLNGADEEWTCPWSACSKSFRKESLLEYHIKYYHTEDGTPVAQQPQPGKKRRKTVSVCECCMAEWCTHLGCIRGSREGQSEDYMVVGSVCVERVPFWYRCYHSMPDINEQVKFVVDGLFFVSKNCSNRFSESTWSYS